MSCGCHTGKSCGCTFPFPWHRPAGVTSARSAAVPGHGMFGTAGPCPAGTRAMRVSRRGVSTSQCIAQRGVRGKEYPGDGGGKVFPGDASK